MVGWSSVSCAFNVHEQKEWNATFCGFFLMNELLFEFLYIRPTAILLCFYLSHLMVALCFLLRWR